MAIESRFLRPKGDIGLTKTNLSLSSISSPGNSSRSSVKEYGSTGFSSMLHYQDDIYIYKFPKQIQVEGPAQISALMNQNPDISRQLTLWNQRGSKVIRGRIIIVPVEHSLLYIQPLYLAASGEHGFPSLAKVIVAMNRHTAMANSLALAFDQLQQRAINTPGSELQRVSDTPVVDSP
jgi:uncharacterized membrane protein (UPF0182 family)